MGLPDRIVVGEKLVERLVRVNGLKSMLQGDNSPTLEFDGNGLTSHRFVHVAYSGDSLVSFSCKCRARFPARFIVAAPLALLLARNRGSLFANWDIEVDGDDVIARVQYTALADGLNELLFKVICHNLIGEVAFVERALHSQGVLAAQPLTLNSLLEFDQWSQ